MSRPARSLVVLLVTSALVAPAVASTASASGVGAFAAAGERVAARTLLLGVQVDRDGASVLSWAVKDRPFLRPPEPERRADGASIVLEIVLRRASGERYARRVAFGPICLDHGPHEPGHLDGDELRPHRDAFLIELPGLDGIDEIELARRDPIRGEPARRVLGTTSLDPARYNAAGSDLPLSALVTSTAGTPIDLAEAADGAAAAASLTSNAVIWPEDLGDTDLYTIWGDPADGDRRLNIVLVPDGYTYAEKPLMEQHAQELVDYFRASTPYKEHDSLINYTLVYAYSIESGTDECDCDIFVDTAFGTGFPDFGGACGSLQNRCISYLSNCDSAGLTNMLAAEQRAPYHDETIVMINTDRYGGCGAGRATYAAASNQSTDLALHETGHSIAGLTDEYVSNAGCGAGTGEINTSVNAIDGAWPEWIADLGPPHEGAGHWQSCVYRPEYTCEMRSLHQDFCAVCNQRWANVFFGHPRVTPTAPAESWSSAPAQVVLHDSVDFSVTPRFAQDPTVTNDILWSFDSGGTPIAVATGVTDYTQVINQLGLTRVKAEVIADTNFVKPEAYGGNRDIVTWAVEVVPTICEVGCADGIPQCDADGDGLGDMCDPCAGDAMNACFGPVAQDLGALVDIRIHTDAGSTDGCAGPLTDCRGETWIADLGAPASPSGYAQLGQPVTCDLGNGCPVDATPAFGCTDPATESMLRCAHEDPAGGSELTYRFDVPDGEYLLNLLFMNVDAATSGIGERIFSVALDGTVPDQLADIDPVALADGPCDPAIGACRPVNRSAVVTVDSGDGLEIELLGNVDRPLIQGIELLCAESTWYPDGDGDGYGVPGASVVACYRPAGYAPNDQDCDDARADAYPGAEERCDGYDNDCDALTDEDDDGDGHDVCTDCLDTEDWQWAVPGEVQNLRYDPARGFLWDPPVPLGSVTGIYSLIRADDPADFDAAACVGENIVLIWYHDDPAVPDPGEAYYYLMRADGPCGSGTLGHDSAGQERTGVACPFTVP